MESQNSTKVKETNTYLAMGYRWSIVIVALGLSAMRTGSERDILSLTILGAAAFLTGSFLWVYKHFYNLGIIVAIVGGSLVLLGNPISNSSLFGSILTETQKTPMLFWGAGLIVVGMAGWAYFRFARN